MTTQQRLMFMFPGVGSHYSGMGKAFYDQFPLVQELFAQASDILHYDMCKLCFSPDMATKLDQLENAQAALLCVSIASYRVLVAESGLSQAIYLGYSLGEYSALCCAGALDLRDTLLLVRDRGMVVTDVATTVDGTMTWVVNVAVERVERICEELRREGEKVFVSAYDSPLKASISGTRAALRKAGERVVTAGGIPIPIKMSGPFHSPLMSSAAERFRQLSSAYTYKMPVFPVIANCTALPYTTAEEIPAQLMLQLVNPIRWQNTLEYALNQGVTTSIEIGPKNVLTYLLEKNTSSMLTYVLDTPKTLDDIRDYFLVRRDTYLLFLSRCLTTIVSTKNYNEETKGYQEKVVMVFKKIQRLYEDIQSGGLIPDTQLFQSVIAMLEGALHFKHIPVIEIATHIKNISKIASH